MISLLGLLLLVSAHSLDGFVAGEVEGIGWDASHVHSLVAVPETFGSHITVVVTVRLVNGADVDFTH